MFLRGFEGWHIVIIIGLLVVLFGARRLPDSARSIGRSLRIFKSEMKAAAHDETTDETQIGAHDDLPGDASSPMAPKPLERARTTRPAHEASSDSDELDRQSAKV